MARTPSTIVVKTLDLAPLKKQADAYVKQNQGAEYHADLGMTWGIVETPEGVFAICTEGVGPDRPITADNLLAIDIYAQSKGGIGIIPVAQANLDADDVRRLATGPEVPLAEYVRTFGARLEANYEMWVRRLSPLANATSLTAL